MAISLRVVCRCNIYPCFSLSLSLPPSLSLSLSPSLPPSLSLSLSTRDGPREELMMDVLLPKHNPNVIDDGKWCPAVMCAKCVRQLGVLSGRMGLVGGLRSDAVFLAVISTKDKKSTGINQRTRPTVTSGCKTHGPLFMLFMFFLSFPTIGSMDRIDNKILISPTCFFFLLQTSTHESRCVNPLPIMSVDKLFGRCI